ncbi:MAG: hypothetical protein JOZ68_16850 [Acidimicrobiia bacterium]|nr:hypothetical protein [Acidimicrobiia bacterium]MBV9042673.1 hypothetical protein [Acidimicrobiia bacterium]
MRRRWPWALASTALFSAIAILAASPSFAQTTTTAPPTTPAEETFRTNFEAMLTGLEPVVNKVQANPSTAAGYKVTGTNTVAALESAKQQVANLDSTNLDALQQALQAYASWQQAPAQMTSAISAFNPPSTKFPYTNDFAGTFTSSCNSAGDPRAEFAAAEAANIAQTAAQAAMLAAPGVAAVFVGIDVPTGVKIALAVVWGVLNGVYLGLSQALAVSTDCFATEFGNEENLILPQGGKRIASEITVQGLITSAQATSATITQALNAIDNVSTQADSLNTAATDLNTTLTDVNTRVSEVKTDLQTLQANVAILKNTQVIELNKAKTAITNLSTFQSLQLRMAIEENLATNKTFTGAVGLYEVPAANGGYLDLVKTIVTDTVNKETAAGQGNPAKAATDLATANNYFANHQYKLAYKTYCTAYNDVA